MPYLAFLDTEKAFDHVLLNKLWNILGEILTYLHTAPPINVQEKQVVVPNINVRVDSILNVEEIWFDIKK